MGSNVNKKFYKTVWFCVLMLFIFAPVGIILLWKNKFFSTRINVIFSIASAMLFIVLLAIPPESNISDVDTSNSSPVSFPDSTAQTTTPTSGSNVEYDALQQLYLDLDPNMSYEDMLDLVKSTGLPYSEEKYNGSRTVQVAFTDGCTVQRHKKESGDYLEIHYDYPDNKNNSDDILDNYIFATCVYCPNDSNLELISHSHGSYFSYYKPGNYISDLGNNLDIDNKMSKKEQLDYYFENK